MHQEFLPPGIVILTGAGISKESGIDTFRDKDGLWTRVNLEEVATIEADAPEKESFFVPIPVGTYYYDEIQGGSIKSGDEGNNPARLPWILCGLIGLGWAAWFGVALARRLARLTAKVDRAAEIA